MRPVLTAKTLFSVAVAAMCTPAFSGQPQIMPSGYDEIFPPKFITSGTPGKSKAECDATPNAVWVTATWTDKGVFSDSTSTTEECVRYFPSDNAIGGKTAILYFWGDIVLEAAAGNDKTNPGYGANNYRAQVALANHHAAVNGVPYILVGRPGMYGSTGNTTLYRHSLREAAIVNAAVDAIKADLGYERISVVGQSGGGGLVGALLTSGRSDLDCVVISSGTVSLKTRLRTSSSTQWVRSGQDTTGLSYRQLYDSLDELDRVVADNERRVFMLADPKDEAVSFVSQKEFADRANEKGVRVLLVVAQGGGKQHHSTSAQGIRTAGRCLAGMTDHEITKRIMENAP